VRGCRVRDGALQQCIAVFRVNLQRFVRMCKAGKVRVSVRELEARHGKQRADGARMHVDGVLQQRLRFVLRAAEGKHVLRTREQQVAAVREYF
jgi:hypothetical protein